MIGGDRALGGDDEVLEWAVSVGANCLLRERLENCEAQQQLAANVFHRTLLDPSS